MDNLKRIAKESGFKIRDAEPAILKNGLLAQRFKLEVGNKLMPFVAVEVDEIQICDSKIVRYIKEYAEFESIILVSNFLSHEVVSDLKEKRIGFIDRFNNVYIPIEFVSFGGEKKISRSTSELNEFLIGYLFFKKNGFLQLTQEEIGNKIKKSATTVNFLLKKMEQEEEILKFGTNKYAIKNIRKFFDDWRFLLKKFQSKNFKSRYSHPENESNYSLMNYHMFHPELIKDVAFGGPLTDTLRNGYLRNAQSFNLYCTEQSFGTVIEQFHLKPDPNGNIFIYESPIPLNDKDGFVHEAMLCAELLNDDDSRVREAGEERFGKLLSKLNTEDYERYYEKNL
jgi:hypothetical protein